MKTPAADGAVPSLKLLLVTSENPLATAISEVSEGIPGCTVHRCQTACEALEFCLRGDFHVVALHHTAQNTLDSAIYFCGQVLKRGVRVIVIGDTHRPDHELQLTRMEHVGYLERPLDLRRFAFLVRHAAIRAERIADQSRLAAEDKESKTPCLLEGCPETRRLMEQVTRVAEQDAMILLLGETGTGKSRLARQIHEMSPRRNEPFIVINCGSGLSSLMDSELFGHVKGAFTGADANRDGKLLAAGRGTVFLDDIEALPMESQVKLLRVLEKDGEFEPLGSNKTLKLHARVIAASNQPLAKLANQGRFRKDLYFRLNVVEFRLPNLCENRMAIEPLARRFIAQFALNQAPVTITNEAICALEAYHWPGNIRELQHAIQRAVMLCSGHTVTVHDLPDSVHESVEQQTPIVADEAFATMCASDTSPGLPLIKSESTMRVLRECGGNKAAAARKLGISREALYKRIRKFSER